jgi:X-X-X-Leu-X-X-Gly heptad repeat protein
MENFEDLINAMHFSVNYQALLLDEGDFTIGRKLQNGSAQVVSGSTRLKNRNFNALPNRCGQKTALKFVGTAFA